MSDLVTGAVGPEAKYDVAFTAGKLVLSLDYAGKQAGLDLSVSIDAKQVLESIKALIPQSAIRDEVFTLLEASLPA